MRTVLTNGKGASATLPPTAGPGGDHAALEYTPDGRLHQTGDGGEYTRLRGNLMETMQVRTDPVFFADLFGLCHEGRLRTAIEIAKRFEGANYNRGLGEGLVSTDLDNALDGSVWTHAYDAWREEEWPWQPVVEVVSYDNYESQKLVTLSQLDVDDETSNRTSSGTLPIVGEGGSYNEADIGEKYETVQIADYGVVFSITDQAMRRDDKAALSVIPQALGRAARRTVSFNVQNILTQTSGAGPTMNENSAAAFSSTRGNLAANALTMANAETGVAAMAGFTSYANASTGVVMGLVPKWLVVPAGYGLTAQAICGVGTERLIDGTSSAKQSDKNVISFLTPIVWPALGAADTTCWFLLTDYREMRHIVVAALDGSLEPILETQGALGPDLSNPRGRKYRIRAPHGVGLADWRGVYAASA
jgi:hypothetical protein